MIKTILKEFIITLLLCVAILLVLSVLFYDYNPINKVIPSKIAYTTPENIKEELEEETIENTLTKQNRIYTVDGVDLNVYIKNNTYNPSKSNPFADTSSDSTNTAENELQNTDKENNTNNQTPGKKPGLK